MLCRRGRHSRAVRRLNRDDVHDRVACLYGGRLVTTYRRRVPKNKHSTMVPTRRHWPGVEVAEVAAEHMGKQGSVPSPEAPDQANAIWNSGRFV